MSPAMVDCAVILRPLCRFSQNNVRVFTRMLKQGHNNGVSRVRGLYGGRGRYFDTLKKKMRLYIKLEKVQRLPLYFLVYRGGSTFSHASWRSLCRTNRKRNTVGQNNGNGRN